jgi:hypothetical protein
MKIHLPQHKLWVIAISLQEHAPGWRVLLGDRYLAAVYATPDDARTATNALIRLGFKWEFVSEP